MYPGENRSTRTLRRTILVLAISLTALVLLADVVHAASQADAEPIPGFGAIIAITAIVVAAIIALRKRRQYTDA